MTQGSLQVVIDQYLNIDARIEGGRTAAERITAVEK